MLPRLRAASPWLLAAVLIAAGVNHVVSTGAYEGLVPGWLGSPRFWVLSSGVAEIAVAAAVAHPRTRRAGALAATGLFVGVFPGNVQMALDARTPLARTAMVARLPAQVPLVLWALEVRRQAQTS